jgi:hypothetical protein
MKTTPKVIRFSALLVFCLFSFSTSVQAQRLMAVSDNLLKNGTAYPVTWKGLSSFPKFQFHTYQVISGKTGWTKSKYNSKLFSRLETASSNYNGSYIMVSLAGDSTVVNFSRNLDYRGLESQGIVIEGPRGSLALGSEAEVLESKDNYVALMETGPTPSVWRLVVTQSFGSQTGLSFFGWLTDGDRRIDIKSVFDYQDAGKKGAMDLMMGGENWHKGFEFFEDARSIGAVQLGPNKKQFVVWLSNDLDSMTELVLAASCIGLLRDFMIVPQ